MSKLGNSNNRWRGVRTNRPPASQGVSNRINAFNSASVSPQYGPGRAIMGWFTHSIADQRHELWTAHVDIWTVDTAAVRGVYSGSL